MHAVVFRRSGGPEVLGVDEVLSCRWEPAHAHRGDVIATGSACPRRVPRPGDDDDVELFTQLDVMHDEAKSYWEPRPWHESFPLQPRTWEVDLATVNIWGPINEAMLDH